MSAVERLVSHCATAEDKFPVGITFTPYLARDATSAGYLVSDEEER